MSFKMTHPIVVGLVVDAYKRGLDEGKVIGRAQLDREVNRSIEDAEGRTKRLIEGLSALAGQAERLPGVSKPDLGPDRQVGRDTALRFCDTLDPEAEYVKRGDVLELFFQLDPRIRGPLAVRYPEMVHQRKP